MEKIFTAKTLDEAKKMASEEFGLDLLDIRFEIIEQPAKKLFGTKGDFRVRASCEPPKATAARPAAEAKPAPAASPSAPVNAESFGFVIEYLKKILAALGLKDFDVNVKSEGENLVLDVTGDDLGIIIGRRGETLDSLQYLAILANNRGGESQNRPRVIVDCNGYREKRADALQTLATRTANKVLKQGRRVTLEPMNPYERRIIHSKVAEISGVYSNSVGEEPFRKVVISSETPKRRDDSRDNRDSRENRDNRGNNKRRENSGVTGRTYKQSSGFSTSFEREYKRVPAAEISQDAADVEKNASLYGKIEL